MTREEKEELNYNLIHKISNGELYKQCSKCRQWILCSSEYFYVANNKTDGLAACCKECKRNQNHHYAITNKDKIKEINHKTNLRPERQKYNREKSKKMKGEGYCKQWYYNNLEKAKAYRIKKLAQKHDITKQQWESCKKYFNDSCAYCGITEKNHKKLHKERLHKEHVKHDGVNDISNCVPACKSCNSQKWKFTIDEWYNKSNPVYTRKRYEKIMQWINNDYQGIE